MIRTVPGDITGLKDIKQAYVYYTLIYEKH
jgi:hypothetical protein